MDQEELIDNTRGPFGSPDGRRSSFGSINAEFVDIPYRFGAIGTDASDARVRIVSGPLGSGKSLLLRRLRDYQNQSGEGSTHVSEVQSSQSLTTDDLAEFQRRTRDRSGNTEQWKLLWRRAIMLSTISMLRHVPSLSARVPSTFLEQLQGHHLLFRSDSPRGVPDYVHEIVSSQTSGFHINRYLGDPAWSDLEFAVAGALRDLPPIFIYLDGIDDNFKWAPGLWSNCQRGLFYAVMDLLREDDFRSRLHVVSALRDSIMASVRASEHALRYRDEVHVKELRWTRKSMRVLVAGKLSKLPDELFVDPSRKDATSWLGTSTLHNSVRGVDEPIEDYLLRHTRLVPRDLVVLGNALSNARLEEERDLYPEEIKEVVADTARVFASAELESCTNQLLSDLLPLDAAGKYEHVFIKPNQYALNDNRAKIVAAIESIGFEAFDLDSLQAVDEHARNAFEALGDRESIRLADILWQHRLLGVVAPNRVGVSFFDPAGRHAELAIERSRGATYVWHPMLVDVIPGISTNYHESVWPS
jgi:hypothetical protein